MRFRCRQTPHRAIKPRKTSFGERGAQRRENTSRKNRHFLLMPPRVWCSVSTPIPMVRNTRIPENYLIPVLMTSLPVQWPFGKGCDKWPLFPYLVFSCKQQHTQKPPRLPGAERTGSGQNEAVRWGYQIENKQTNNQNKTQRIWATNSLSPPCCCQESGCNRGTKSSDKMPRNSHARCPQEPSGDEFSACKYFLIHPILN